MSYVFYVRTKKATTYLDFRNTAYDKAVTNRWEERKLRFEFLTGFSDLDSLKRKLKGSFVYQEPSEKRWGCVGAEYGEGWKADPKSQKELQRRMIEDLRVLAEWIDPRLGEIRRLCGE